MVKKFIDAFPGGDSSLQKELAILLQQLESKSDTFCGLVWLHDHDWLWMSAGVENVLAHPQQKFLDRHGLLYFQSLTPHRWVEHIFHSLRTFITRLETDPRRILAPLIARVDAALLHADGYEIPIAHSSSFIDCRPGHQNSYLILGCWIAMDGKSNMEIENIRTDMERLLLQIKDVYFRMYPERLQLCTIRQKITDREIEIAKLLATGYSTKAIGEKLGISFNTVESHRKNLLEKFGVRNTAEMINKARKVLILID